MARILVIDDDAEFLKLMEVFLRNTQHEALTLTHGGAVVEEILRFSPDVLITDIIMPGITGGSIYNIVRQQIGPQLPIIVCSGTRMQVRPARRDPLLEHCPKPVDFSHLAAVIERLLTPPRQSDAGENS